MSPLVQRCTLRAFATFALALLALTLFAACGDGDENDAKPTAEERTPTVEEATRAPVEPTPGGGGEGGTPTEFPTPRSEAGEAPIFWRTEDNFESLRAGKPYKVVFRITSGYDEETLHVGAFPEGSDAGFGFEPNRVEPVGEEGPGTFYHFLLELPDSGTWQMTVTAGDDQVTITVEAGPPAS